MTQSPLPDPQNLPPNPHRISDETFESRKKPGSVWKYVAIGCLGIIVVSIILAVIAGAVAYKNWRSWSADFATSTSRKVINSSELPEDQKTRMITRIEAVAKDFKDGKLTVEQMGMIADRVSKSPMLNMGMVYFFEQQYLRPSGLTQEEKTQGRRTLERLARGVYEKSITKHEMETLTAPLMEARGGGRKRLRKHISDTELRDFLTKTATQVEVARIPDEPFAVDMADELDKVIDEVVTGKALPAAATRKKVENKVPDRLKELEITDQD